MANMRSKYQRDRSSFRDIQSGNVGYEEFSENDYELQQSNPNMLLLLSVYSARIKTSAWNRYKIVNMNSAVFVVFMDR